MACLLALALPLSAPGLPPQQDPDEKSAGAPVPEPDTPPDKPAAASPLPSLESLKVPAGAVLVVAGEVKEALGMVPGWVLLSPEKYQELLTQIEQLRAQLQPEKPDPPSVCKLSGRVEGDVVQLTAQFGFRTERDLAWIALGCPQSYPTGVKLDDQLPVLRYSSDEGWSVQVEKAGEHRLTFEMDVPLTTRGAPRNEQGFELDLPRAAITTLELDLPDSVKEVRVLSDQMKLKDGRPRGEAIPVQPQDGGRGRLNAGALGPVKQLEVTWEGPAPQPAGPPLLAVEGRIDVSVDEASITTIAKLTLRVLRGQTDRWHLQVPAEAVVEITNQPAEESTRAIVEPIDPKNPTRRVIRLLQPSADELQVSVLVSRRRTEAPFPIGPFAVPNAFRQWGTIVVSAPADLRLRYYPRGAVSQRDASEEQRQNPRVVAAFTYWNLSTPEAAEQAAAPLDLEIKTVKGDVETRVMHTVRLSRRGWQISTEISARPVRTGADQLQVHLPAGYQLDESVGIQPAELVQTVEQNPLSQTALITLTRKQLEPFKLTLEGFYPPPGPASRRTSLELPRPVQTLDRGGQVTVLLPEELELVPPRPGDPTWEKHQHTWTQDRIPERVDLAWRPYRPDLPVQSTAEVTLAGQQGLVRQQLRFQFARTPPSQVDLRVPERLADRIRVVEGGTPPPLGETPPPDETGFQIMPVVLSRPVGQEHLLILEYSFPLPGAEQATEPAEENPAGSVTFTVPLVVPEQATQGEARVLVWTDLGIVPRLAAGPWEEQPTEATARDSLPALVLRGSRLGLPLSLRLSESATPGGTALLIERALVRAAVGEEGQQSYRVSFLVSRLATPYLDFEFSLPPASLSLDAFLIDPEGAGAGKLIRWEPVDSSGQPSATGRIARLYVGAGFTGKPVILDLVYQMAPHRGGALDLLQTRLHPPLPRHGLSRMPVRWQVDLPPGWVPLYQGGSFAPEQQWGWRGWLLAPQPTATAEDLERWFAGHEVPARIGPGEGQGRPSLVSWRSSLQSLELTHVPQQAWLLACSLALLVIGLSLYFLPLPRSVFWLVTGLLGLAVAIVGVLWPGLLSEVIYGCEPGAVVLTVALGVQWMLQERYRRQLVFMPGFTRVKPGSSLVRSGSSNSSGSAKRPRPEPSTVDAPPAPPDDGVTG